MKNPNLMQAKAEVQRINYYIYLGESLLEKELDTEEKNYVNNNLETLREKLSAYEQLVEANREKFFSDAQIASEGRDPLTIEDLLKEDISSLEWGIRISKVAQYFFSACSYVSIPKLRTKAIELAKFCEQKTQRYEERKKLAKKVKDLNRLQKERKKKYYNEVKDFFAKSGTQVDEKLLKQFAENPLLLVYSTFEHLKEKYKDPFEGEYDFLRPEK